MTTVATVSVAAPVGHTVADGDELGQTVEQNRHKQLYTAIDILEGLNPLTTVPSEPNPSIKY